jgi:hypothetical protein
MGRKKGSLNKHINKILFICQHCKKKWLDFPCRKKIKKFCSHRCRALNSNNLFKKGNKINLGKHHSEETIKKIILANKGKIRPNISKSKIGNKNPNWKNGVTPKNKLLRCGSKWKQWRKSIFEYDNYTCWICEIKGNELHPHHLKSFSKYPKLRFIKNNGLTLCEFCHKTYTVFRNPKNQK